MIWFVRKGLCQDCLRVGVETADAQPCECGGDICACSACLGTIKLLQAGERDYVRLGLQRPITGAQWSPERGLFQ